MKKRTLQILSLLLLVLLVLVLCLCLKYCGKTPADPETTPPATNEPGQTQTYTVTVTDEAGNPLESIGVCVYEDETQNELVWFARTDKDGKITFTYQVSTACVAVLSELPEGCTAEALYPITGPETTIVLSGTPVGEAAWKLGNNMPDFTFTDCEGNTYTLSQLLEEKEAVVLNFWYTGCAPCKTEFPYLQEAYEQYSDRIALLAVDPVDKDNAVIAKYKGDNGLTFPMGAVPPEWEQLMGIKGYPTTVVIDRNGVISLIHTGSVPDTETFTDIFEHFTGDDYVPGVVEDIKDITGEEPPAHLGTKDDPLEFPGQMSFELVIPAGQETYFSLTKIQNMYMQLNDGEVTVVYNDRTYTGSNGKVSLMVNCPDTFTPITICVKNPTDQDKTVKVTLSYPGGTVNNPYTMKEGETAVKLPAGQDQGLVYQFTAPADGEFTVSCLSVSPKVDYDIVLFNTSSNALRNLEADGTTDADGNPCVTVKMKKGQTVQVTVTTLPDAAQNFPAATIQCKASFTAGSSGPEEPEVTLVNYAITVTDEDRKPIKDVAFQIQMETGVQRIVTGADGIARVQLPAGTYPVTMNIPVGYKADVTQFTLSEAIPMFAIKLDKKEIVTETYTVKVQNAKGEPLANVMVALDTSVAYTDASGSASFTLPVGSYTAQISVPAGYDDSVKAFSFAKGQTSLTITLQEKATDPSETVPTLTTYTVTVKDYNGEACKTAVVKVLKDGKEVDMAAVNAQGVAAFDLEAGTYTVKLSFSGSAMHYEEATLTENAPSTTILVAAGVSGEPTEYYFGYVYDVPVGGTYVEMQSNVVNYYLFTPEVAGFYRFTTSDPNAKISYWGGNVNYVRDMTSNTDYDENGDNSYTMNIKENALSGIVMIGITGADDCVLEITRVSDPLIDEDDMIPKVYEAKTTPKPFDFTLQAGQKIVYFDMTASTGDVKLVYSAADQYYHLGSETGPVVYMDLGFKAPYVSIADIVGLGQFGASIGRTFRDENGKALYKEDYTKCFYEYASCTNYQGNGLYPLTEDLIYMMQNGGVEKGWWNVESPGYLFEDRNGNPIPGINPEIAWMFACCTIE